jgi:hypothetical protein
MNGWIKLHRQLSEWEWYHDSQMVHLFVHLLLTANHKTKNCEGTILETGQLITSLHLLKKQTGISIQTIKTCLIKLQKTNEIKCHTTYLNRTITLLNYAKYQGVLTKQTASNCSLNYTRKLEQEKKLTKCQQSEIKKSTKQKTNKLTKQKTNKLTKQAPTNCSLNYTRKNFLKKNQQSENATNQQSENATNQQSKIKKSTKQEKKNKLKNKRTKNNKNIRKNKIHDDKSSGVLKDMKKDSLNEEGIVYEYEDCETPKKYRHRKNLYARLAVYYMKLSGKTGNVLRYYRDIKELVELADRDSKPEDVEEEIKLRMDVAKWHYDNIKVNEWGLGKLVENWDKILEWNKNKKKTL